MEGDTSVTDDAGPPDATVRAARTPADWAAIRELCCRTGNAGDPIEASRWPFFAEAWVGPYQHLIPGWTYVAEAAGEVVGYLTGCPDTRAFNRARFLRFALPLVLRIVRGRYPRNADTCRFVRRTLRLKQGPEDHLLRRLPPSLYVEYPAHLHMNVAVGFRGQGIGRRLIAYYVEDLRRRDAPGLHLFCGAVARPFYRRLGFEDLADLEVRPGVRVHALGRRLQ